MSKISFKKGLKYGGSAYTWQGDILMGKLNKEVYFYT